ncbi:hypothetical protein [Rhodovulum visakhapatnamense]|uniref:Uncharacterized protein n=1 Tax=Rhodovulum visakhapatnamense TaxID=364297 RepID=A0A4R8GCQ2_9RHOB|nr:hypothetical protein [Rhodovulum visakhapatnamense]TDX33672.1 hypothetical protein EV657_101100 [Rhodovulum visakhapatnamense]
MWRSLRRLLSRCPMWRPEARPFRIAAALAACLALVGPAPARTTDPAFPALDCAALWDATADFRALYALAEGPPDEARAMARAFRDAAVALSDDPEAEVDARIAKLRPIYLLLLKRYILNGNRRARDRYVRLSGLCDDFGRDAALPGHQGPGR